MGTVSPNPPRTRRGSPSAILVEQPRYATPDLSSVKSPFREGVWLPPSLLVDSNPDPTGPPAFLNVSLWLGLSNRGPQHGFGSRKPQSGVGPCHASPVRPYSRKLRGCFVGSAIFLLQASGCGCSSGGPSVASFFGSRRVGLVRDIQSQLGFKRFSGSGSVSSSGSGFGSPLYR